MGYDVMLKNPVTGECVTVEPFMDGSNICVGGQTEASVCITYNYSRFYYETINAELGLRWLDGRPAWECVVLLDAAVGELGTIRSDNYWAATPGNAGHMLALLLAWARQHPNAVFVVE